MSDNEEDYESNVGSDSDETSVVSDNDSVVSETVEAETGAGGEGEGSGGTAGSPASSTGASI